MRRRAVRGVTFRVAAVEVSGETLSIGIAGDILVLSTTLPGQGITCHSTYHGHGGLDTVAVRLNLVPGRNERVIEERPRDDLPVTHARDRCLLDHLAHVRNVLEQTAGDEVTVEIGDAALSVA